MIDPRRAAIDRPEDHQAMRALYERMVALWNQRNAVGLARCFDLEGVLVAPDGAVAQGREAIRACLDATFASGQAPTLEVDEVRTRKISFHAGMLHARVRNGPEAGAVQSLVACSEYDEWLAELFQTTQSVGGVSNR